MSQIPLYQLMMGLPVQLFTILILVTLPIIFVQFYTAHSPVLMGEDETLSPTIEALYEQISLPESNEIKQQLLEQSTDKHDVALQQNSLFLLDDKIEGVMDEAKRTNDKPADVSLENAITEPVNHKKVRLVKGKQHVQGMEFLSVILMLKEKQR